jgi:hypothetical protein
VANTHGLLWHQEGRMKFVIVAEIIVLVIAGALTLSSVANAQPSSRACWSMANTVKAALDSHPDASQDARDHYQTGMEACAKGYTALGISNLQAAMKALGG